ncbi:hypothetical protein NE852_23600 [Rhizobium sp. Pop5]|uniref:hypothetical protein n=1 Tax=Rhizobium sp. Pop5 TaxID=1223565 RepID=UPI0002837303|nr:hypothetical protein [Rhizobium sp. Pop5]EJZ22151.1 restriction endonuclease-like protein [Rhizobium sp. Pop5]UVD56991.1 hypothetical protein NE852_23600 [Rhizobium sp. Pop5]
MKLVTADGKRINATLDLDQLSVIVRCRGGTIGNRDYRRAVELLLARLDTATIPYEIYLGIRSSKDIFLPGRRLLFTKEEPVATRFDQLIREMNAGTKSRGAWRTLLVATSETSHDQLKLALQPFEPTPKIVRLSAEILRKVETAHIDRAVQKLLGGGDAPNFEPSRDYDAVTSEGIPLAPKKVFGLALEYALRIEAHPGHFSAGWGQICFEALEAAGLRIVPKNNARERPKASPAALAIPNIYAYRLAPSGIDRVVELLEDNQIAIGWSALDEQTVLNFAVTKDEIREKLASLYPQLAAQKRITHGTNQVWRFIQEVRVNDIVIVPHLGKAYFLRVTGNPIHLSHKVEDDTAIRRDISKLKTVAISSLPTAIREGLIFRGHASIRLEDIKDAVMDFLGIDRELAAEENEAVRAEKLMYEAMGSYVIPAKDEIIVTRKHAEVSEALIRHLQAKGLKVVNTRTAGLAPDLYTMCPTDPMLFEIKTGSGPGDYLKALGQLLFYEKLRGRSFRKLLVAPTGIGQLTSSVLESFDVEVVEYTEADGNFTFRWS